MKDWRLTAQARALLAGFNALLSEADDGAPVLIVSRWALTKSFADAATFDAWLARVAGKAAA